MRTRGERLAGAVRRLPKLARNWAGHLLHHAAGVDELAAGQQLLRGLEAALALRLGQAPA